MTSNVSQPNEAPAADPTRPRPDLIPAVGSLWTGTLTFLGETAILAGQAFRWMVRGGIDLRDLITQMALLGADSIWIVLAITTATGAVFALYTTTLALKIGFTQFVGGTMGYGFLNELGPLLSGVAFASRAGAAIAAEIGSMVVTEQIDALRSMAISPVRYLVVPRVLSGIIMLPLLTALADIAGLYGGYLVSVGKGVPPQSFLDSMQTYTVTSDLFNGLLKSLVFGFIVGIVACQQGLRTKGGATGVGRATTSSVVLCVVMIFVADFFLTQILTTRDNGRQSSIAPARSYYANERAPAAGTTGPTAFAGPALSPCPLAAKRPDHMPAGPRGFAVAVFAQRGGQPVPGSRPPRAAPTAT